MNQTTEQYDDWARTTVQAAIERGASSLWQIVAMCDGADPLLVREVILNAGYQQVLLGPDAADRSVGDGPVEPTLPAPHPLDFEWRFSRRGVAALIEELALAAGGDLLLLGATTVAIAAARQGWPGRLTAVDHSEVTVQRAQTLGLPITFVVGDVAEVGNASGHADVVVIDAPWYAESMHAFLSVGASACRVGGHVFLVVPGNGTRPGMRDEKALLRGACAGQGLTLVDVHPQAIAYETPYFERNAFQAAGLATVAMNWRRGELWVLRRDHERDVNMLRPAPPIRWDEVMVGGMRARFRMGLPHTARSDMTSIVVGDILPSVSRRDSRREAVRVWTTGNRVFGCDDPALLCAGIRSRTSGGDEVEAAQEVLKRCMTRSEAVSLKNGCDRLVGLGAQEEHEQT